MFDCLLRAGGALRQAIVCQDHIKECRLWDLAPDLPLDLTERSSHLLQCLQEALRHDQKIKLPPPDAKQGDPFFYHAVYQLICQDPNLPQFSTCLRHVSPLTRLCLTPAVGHHGTLTFEDGQTGQPAVTDEECHALATHPVMPFLVGHLADQWSDMATIAPHQQADIQVDRVNAKRATMQRFLNACSQTGRFSVMRLFPLFFQRLMQADFRSYATQVLGFQTWWVSAKESMIQALSGLLQLAEPLEEAIQTHIIRPGSYGWQYPLETRIFMSTTGRMWTTGGLHDQILETRHYLRTQMG